MTKKYIRISRDDLKEILSDAVVGELKEIESMGADVKTSLLMTVCGASIMRRVMNSLPGEVYESDDIDFPNSNSK